MVNKTNIDETDAIILRCLLNEARTSFTEIAKKCNISVGAVRMRYKNLCKAGIINGAVMLVNPFSLGYKYISGIGVITTKENESEVAEFLKKLPYSPIISGGKLGKYNFFYQAALKNIEELSKLQRKVEANPIIKRADAFIWSEKIIPEHPENLVIEPFSGTIENKPIIIKQPEKEIQIDETDREIAKILSRKARTSFMKIATHLGISPKSVIERYKRLRGTVLTLSTITVDLNKLGYTGGFFAFIKLANKSKMSEVVAQLFKIPNLITFVKYIGTYDLFAHVIFEDFQEYFKIADEINKIQNIEEIEVFLVPPFPAWPPNTFASLL